jgi:LPXTG-motif cell wall-anchored protein
LYLVNKDHCPYRLIGVAVTLRSDSEHFSSESGRLESRPVVNATKRVTIGGFLGTALMLLSSTTVHANAFNTWTNSWCGPSSTWSGLAGLNNDYPGSATVTGLTVSDGVTTAGVTVGQVIGSFERGNLEASGSGLSMSLPSFSVTITIALADGRSVARTMQVTRPSECVAAVVTTTTIVATTTTEPPLSTSIPNGPTTPVSPTAPISPPPPVATTAPRGATVPLEPSVLGTTVTSSPSANSTLPKTGGQRTGAMTAFAAAVVVSGLVLVSIARIGRQQAV